MVSPRSQIEMLETSFEDVFLVGIKSEPHRRSLMSSCERSRPRATSDYGSPKLQRKLGFSDESAPNSTTSTIGLNTGLIQGTSLSPEKIEMNSALMMPDEWMFICNNALSISSSFKVLAEEEIALILSDWYADDFDLRTCHCPWQTCSLDLPELDSSINDEPQNSFIDFSNSKLLSDVGISSFELSTMKTTDYLLGMDDSLTACDHLLLTPKRNESYVIAKNDASFTIAKNNASFTIAKNDASFTIAKNNASFTIAKNDVSFTIAKNDASFTIAKNNASFTIARESSPIEISQTPGSAKKNSSFSEAAEKFHSLRRSMSSDSVMPLSQEKLRGLSLTTRALVADAALATTPAPADDFKAATAESFKAAAADFKLRPGRAAHAKGPMRAMLPLGQMMRATNETVAPPTLQSPAKFSPAVDVMAASTPLRKNTPLRRSISTSPVRRATPVRSPSSGYGQRAATPESRSRAVARALLSPAVKAAEAPRAGKPTGAIAKSLLPTAMVSRLRWPSAKGIAKSADVVKGIPKPVLAVCDANVRASREQALRRCPNAPQMAWRGKENKL